MRRPLLVLPRPPADFILGDHATDLLASTGGSVALPGRVPFGALLRAPGPAAGPLASALARRLGAQRPTGWRPEETVAIGYHAVQWPAIERLLARGAVGAAWYCRWDRYELAGDAGSAARERLARWHEAFAARSELTFCVSGRLAELERKAGREAIVVGLSADDFPDGPLLPEARGAALVAAAGSRAAGGTGGGPDADDRVVGDGPVAVSLGHLGRRTDWAWLRAAVEGVPGLQLLLIGAWHEEEVGDDPDARWLRTCPRARWLGPLDDAEAAAVIAQADIGLVPFLRDPFNDAGLPTRILKYARLGRATISPTLAGSATWARAVTFADAPEHVAAALIAAAGRRHRPDADLRTWALEQTAAAMNAPLLDRL